MKQTNKIVAVIALCMAWVVTLAFLSGCVGTLAGGTSSETSSTASSSDVVSSEVSSSSVASLDDSASKSEDFVPPEWFIDYPSILDEYRRFADCEILNDDTGRLFDWDIFSVPEDNNSLYHENSFSYHWGCMTGEAKVSSEKYPKMRDAFGYALEDLNGDGSDELILLLQDYTVLAAFSTVDGKPKLLDAFWSRHRCAITDSGLLYTLSSGGATVWFYSILKISPNDNQLLPVEQYGMDTYEHPGDGYYKIVDGETHSISKSEFDEFYKRFPSVSDPDFRKITKNSGIKLIPLFDESC